MREVKKEDVVLAEGKKASNVYIILSGSVQFLKRDNGGIFWPIAVLSKGDMFGELSFLGYNPTFAQVIAKEKTTLLKLNHEHLETVVSLNEGFGQRLYQVLATSLSRKLMHANENIFSEARQVALSIRHEISSPLSLISLAAMQIKEASCEALEKNTSFYKKASAIMSAAERISKILRAPNLVKGAALDEPKETVNVKKLIEETIELCATKLDKEGVQLDVDAVPPHLLVDCCSVQISQVILNLLNNACDAVREQPEKWIKVAARENDHRIEISVIDSGPVIPDEIRSKIFQTFFTTKSPKQGTGLGLSISKKIVEFHGGELELNESKENTRFDVRLPLGQRNYRSTINPIDTKDVSGHGLANKNSDNI